MSKFFELLNSIITKLNRSVSIDPQNLTDEEKAQIRANIGAGTGGGTGGGVSSWNDLTDKPFGETGTKIVWDGAIPDVYYDLTDIFGVVLYKIAEPVSTLNGLLFREADYSDYIGPLDETAYRVCEGAEYTTDATVWNVTSTSVIFDATEIGGPSEMHLEFPETGIYILPYFSYLELLGPDYEIKQIDEKYIPIKSNDVDLSNYYTKSEVYAKDEVYTKSEVNNQIQSLNDLIGKCNTVINDINALIG